MRWKNLYEITFSTRNHGWHKHMIHIEAFNMKEAKEEAKRLWYEVYKSHMFSIECRKIGDEEIVDMVHWFVEISN